MGATLEVALPPFSITHRAYCHGPQAIFRGDCAKCHAEPAKDKMGKELYTAACGICHEAKHRASMVPDLKTHPLPQHLPQWLHLISTGKANTLMPAFYHKHGGPLSPEQVRSLANLMHNEFRQTGSLK